MDHRAIEVALIFDQAMNTGSAGAPPAMSANRERV